ncbi:MAG: endonuclease/exonuclease/phosphatase family protein [Actinobacteria bacterium]|nr:endonuclease/exonuclease/phosphatase family protein [Actinomycetota bacterium]
MATDPAPAKPAQIGALIATAFSVQLGVSSIRVLFPLAYALRERSGTITVAAFTLLIFLAPALAGPLRRAVGGRVGVATALSGLVATTLAMQFARPIHFWLAAMATAFALIGWTLLLHAFRSNGSQLGGVFAISFVGGLTLDTAVHAAFATWDPAWQPGALPAIAAVALSAALVATIPSAMAAVHGQAGETLFRQVLPASALGPFLLVNILFLQNVAFADSLAGISLAKGAAVVLAGDTLSIAAIAWGVGRESPRFRIMAGAVLVALAWFVTGLHGLAAGAALVAASAIAGPLLAGALSRGGPPSGGTAWRTSIAVSMGTVLFIASAFLYQIHVTNPLPFSNRFIPPLAALLLARAPAGAAFAAVPIPRRVVALPLAFLVIVPLAVSATLPGTAVVRGDGRNLRILDWNVHSAVGANGMLDPAALAAVIERQQPDVVVLQEISRGWTIAGTIDLAEWLSSRLGLPYAWAPAADGQFGNVVLSRLPILRAEAVPLPYGSGPQHRSFVRVDVSLGSGTTATVIGAHLENGGGTGTRAQQIRRILTYLGNAPRTIIAGDMNMQPSDADLALFENAGLQSAQDVTGNGALSSARDPNFPGDRPDWIFGTKDVSFSHLGGAICGSCSWFPAPRPTGARLRTFTRSGFA